MGYGSGFKIRVLRALQLGFWGESVLGIELWDFATGLGSRLGFDRKKGF